MTKSDGSTFPRRLAWPCFWLYSLAVLVTALIPGEDLPVFIRDANDLVLHFLEFFLLFLLAQNAFPQSDRAFLVRRTSLWAVVWSLVLAVATEVGQLYVPGRYGDILDFFSDLAGALTAFLCLAVLGRLNANLERQAV